MTIPDDILMAFADGEVDDATRQRVEAAERDDVEVRKRIAQHRQLRAMLQKNYAPTLDESVPARLIAAVRQTPMAPNAPVHPIAIVAPIAPVAALPTDRSWLRTWPAMGSLAASLLVGLCMGYLAWHGTDEMLRTASDGSVTAGGMLQKALSTQLSTDRTGELAAVIGLSFRAKTGEYCRTFTLTAGNASGLACRERDHWRVEMLAPGGVGAPVADYRMAGSTDSPQLRSLVESDMRGEPLTQAEEADARSAGWNAPPH